MNEPDDFRGYDLTKSDVGPQPNQGEDERPTKLTDLDRQLIAQAKPGTIQHYQQHEACQQRINTLTDLLEEIAEECDDRADADMRGDPPRYVPNKWMQLLTRIREVVPR